jgi:hypothetical protein
LPSTQETLVAEQAERSQLSWEIGIPLVTNPRMLWTFALVTGLSMAVVVLLIGVVFGSQGEWEEVLVMARIFALVGVGLYLLFLLVMGLVFGNRLRTRYTVDDGGIVQETVDKVGKVGSRLAVIAGILGRSPGTTGAGLIAMSNEVAALSWDGAFRVDAVPHRHLLVFRNAWRPIMEVYCTPENYAAVEALVRDRMAHRRTAERVAAKSPLPQYLLHTVLILVASFFVLVAYDEFDLDVLVPMIMLAFALATLWLIPLFGYVVLLTNALVLFAFVAVLLEERTSIFRRGETYLHYEVFSDADWGHLIAALLALAYLSWLSIRAVRGKLLSLLVRDQGDMSG